MPTAAITSASETLPQVTPMAPAAICWSAIVRRLVALHVRPPLFAPRGDELGHRRMLRSIAGTSRHKRGVSRSSFCEPISD